MVANGQTVKLNFDNIVTPKSDLPKDLQPYANGEHFYLGDQRDGSQYPRVNDQGYVTFTGKDSYHPDFFMSAYDTGPSSGPKTYTIIIEHGLKEGTLEVLDINGVVSHEYRDAGLLIKLTEDEQFYPWSYGYGIDTVTVTKTE